MQRACVAGGLAAIVVGAAALASDRVTLYDALVYHLGIVRWLREVGTVPGVALIHNRLGHVSAWFTLAAAFESGPGTNRAANVPLGFALVLVGIQASVALARVVAGRTEVADWFLLLTSAALIWPVVSHDAATPSPDVATNVLIVVASWSILVLSRRAQPVKTRLVPFAIALGACSMKLFAVSAVAATGLYWIMARPRPEGTVGLVRRAVAALALSVGLLGPFVVANVVASGCPAYPSPVGCLRTSWSVTAPRAADYARYVRDVARWERRGVTSAGASFGWIVPWVLAHPLISALAVLSPVIGVVLWRRQRPGDDDTDGPDHDAERAVIALGVLGIAFVAWQAPAPRFLYAFVTVIPALALAAVFSARGGGARGAGSPRRFALGFVAGGAVAGFAYALASQKLNVRSAVIHGSRVASVRESELILPGAPEPPQRLFRWRVNDLEVLTPVPRPIADTLGYESVIGFNSSFEKCSTAPLPCTPYLPIDGVRLRAPSRGLAGGFARAASPGLTGRVLSCLGEVNVSAGSSLSEPTTASSATDPARCGRSDR